MNTITSTDGTVIACDKPVSHMTAFQASSKIRVKDADALSYLVERYPLLITKLYIPRLDSKFLTRPHLLQLLDQAVNRPLVLITAPAGWGKTTLAANWALRSESATGWVSLDEGDNDLARFWLHLVASLQQIHKGVGETALSWFYMSAAPPVEARLSMLINDLALARETFVLVIDDIHYIQSPVVRDSLTFFIEHLPPNVHLILTGRTNPLLPLARWRAGHQLMELDSQNLRFSPEECMEFLHTGMGLDLTTEQIASLLDRTEGWVAGIQLAALALQGTSFPQERIDVDEFIAGLGVTNSYIFDYLSEEVLARQAPQVQEFLLKTSVLERLSGDLCEAVSGIRNSQRILEMLAQIKLFTVSLDAERHWYRYHHLFRDFLYSQLVRARPDVVTDLHRDAAKWYAANDLPYDALPHAMLVKDYSLAGRIIMQYGNDLWRREEYTILRNWLGALPLELRESHPDLCLFHAWSLFRTLGLDEMLSMVTRAKALLDEGAKPLGNFSTGELRGMLAIIQGAVSIAQQDLDAAAPLIRSALEQLPSEQKDWRYAALFGAGLVHYYHNNTYAAVQAFEEAFKAAVAIQPGAGNFYGRSSLAISWLARLYMVRGSLHRAKEIYEEALVLATGQTGNPLPTGAWALSGLGELYYQWNDLVIAEKYFNNSLALSSQLIPSTAPPYIPLAHLAYARGEVQMADAYLTEAVRLAEKAGIPAFFKEVNLCQAWFALQRRDLKALEEWIRKQGLDFAQPTPPREAEYIMAARILITRHEYHRAFELVEKLLAIAEEGGRGGVVIELLILQSLALQGQAKADSALIVLQRAIALASQEEYVRIFVDEGEPMLRLLRLFVARFGTTDYSVRLISAFAGKGETSDVLNDRELDVLRLLATGMSNREIGETLFITAGTVKWHAHHIYTKLDVKSRCQAIAKARELHLLPNSTS